MPRGRIPGSGKSLAERFWPKVAMIPFHGCWEWMGARSPKGYGMAYFQNSGGVRAFRVHRVLMWLQTGLPLDSPAFAMHRCDNPPCFNPDHLFLGTHQDNTDDRVAKGRGRCAGSPGEKNPRAKVTERDVLEIRAHEGSLIPLAERYGLAKTTLCSIRLGRSWRHVAGPIVRQSQKGRV